MTNWIITSSVLILIMIAARSLFKGHISPLLQYALWLIVLVRLVVPFNPLESSISVLNAVPTSLSAASGVTKNTENLTPETFTAAPAADYTAADSATADSAVAHTETDIFDAPKITTSVPAQSGLLSFSFVLGTLWLTGTAALLIYRYAQNIGLDVSLDEMWVLDMMESYPRLEEEWVRAILYLNHADITSKDYELEEFFDKATNRISRYQMTSFLFYFCSYELGLDG